jgi:hypothetical protein
VNIILVIVFIVAAFVLGWKAGDKVATAVANLAKDLFAKFVALFNKK